MSKCWCVARSGSRITLYGQGQTLSDAAMPRHPRATVAFCYDFDGTLAPGNMQEHSFIPDVSMSSGDFWAKAKQLAKSQEADEILAYMKVMLEEAERCNVSVRKADFASRGAQLSFYEGVEDCSHVLMSTQRHLALRLSTMSSHLVSEK